MFFCTTSIWLKSPRRNLTWTCPALFIFLLRPLIGWKFLEQALRNKRREWNILTIFLHLFLCILWALECKVLKSREHSSSAVDSAHQFVSRTERHSKSKILGVVLGSLGPHDASWTFQPSNNLETSFCCQFGVWNNIMKILSRYIDIIYPPEGKSNWKFQNYVNYILELKWKVLS